MNPTVVSEWFSVQAIANSGDIRSINSHLDTFAEIVSFLQRKQKVMNRYVNCIGHAFR